MPVFFFDKFVENISKLETQIKDNIQDCKSLIVDIESELEILTVNKNMAYLEMTDNASQKHVLKPLIDSMNKKIQEYTQMKKKSAELKKHKSKLLIQKMRNSNEQGTKNLLYKILEYNIKKQNFHRGAMNSVCSCQLLDNVDPIFDKI